VQLRLAADGEVLLKAPQMMRGYHRSELPAFDEAGWFHTGDLAVQHDDGFLEIVGRSNELIISGGENIHPAEIEHIVATWPGVADCAVVGVPDAQWGEVPVLVVVPQPGTRPDIAALQVSLQTQLARFKLPRRVVLMDALPKTALGKVQRAVLRKLLK
jgi:fatty-acyl-CoA synthase